MTNKAETSVFLVRGKDPENSVGEEYRAPAHLWRPLWDYLVNIAPDLLCEVKGHLRVGDGLDERDTAKLISRIYVDFDCGGTEDYEVDYVMRIASLPLDICPACDGSGQIESVSAIDYSVTPFECPHCSGIGSLAHWEMDYTFSAQNVLHFAEFLRYSGGFEVH